ncbi:MAG: hypothetical protein KGJ90_04895 [Patescibacteria group bacterium]|nr:hypothetical protein [Patescibacteria group bacterium]
MRKAATNILIVSIISAVAGGVFTAITWVTTQIQVAVAPVQAQVDENTNSISSIQSNLAAVNTNLEWIKSALKSNGFNATTTP